MAVERLVAHAGRLVEHAERHDAGRALPVGPVARRARARCRRSRGTATRSRGSRRAGYRPSARIASYCARVSCASTQIDTSARTGSSSSGIGTIDGICAVVVVDVDLQPARRAREELRRDVVDELRAHVGAPRATAGPTRGRSSFSMRRKLVQAGLSTGARHRHLVAGDERVGALGDVIGLVHVVGHQPGRTVAPGRARVGEPVDALDRGAVGEMEVRDRIERAPVADRREVPRRTARRARAGSPRRCPTRACDSRASTRSGAAGSSARSCARRSSSLQRRSRARRGSRGSARASRSAGAAAGRGAVARRPVR